MAPITAQAAPCSAAIWPSLPKPFPARKWTSGLSDGVYLCGVKSVILGWLVVCVRVCGVIGWVIDWGSRGEVVLWEVKVVIGGGTSDGGVYGAFNASFEAGAELHVATRSLAIPSALHEDKF